MPGQGVGIQGGPLQQAIGQGERHLRVVGERAGGQAACLHGAHEPVGRDGRPELQRHPQRVTDRGADGDPA